MLWLVFDGVQKSDLKNTHIFADAYQGLALYRCQTLIRGWNTFTLTCAVRYFKPLIIIQVTELTLLWYDLCLMWYRKMTKKITGILVDAYQALAMYMCQTLIRSLNTFTYTCAVRYLKPLIIIQVTELTLLCYDLCLMWYWKVTKKIQASLLLHIKVWHCIGVKPWSEAEIPLASLVLWGILSLWS
jgi:hypothetical protein